MPKAVRKQEDIEAVKQVILDAALEIMINAGFAQLSMRKIASRVSMTAANIYNYFSNKDEIYLSIQTRGFRALYARFQEIDGASLDSVEKLKKLTRAYYDFGTQNPELYEILFTRNTPKFTDYLGTKLEPAAITEKEAALRVLDLTSGLIFRIMDKHSGHSKEEAHYRAIYHWTSLHGIVSLYNSRVLQETIDVTEETIEKLTTDLLLPFMTELENTI
jgi:AcrR family transcriptional regulator